MFQFHWAGRIGLAIIALSTCQLAATQGTSPLTFVVPTAQQAQGGAVSSDPTIRPFNAPGVPSPPLLTTSIDLQGNGRPDFIACHGSYPPDPEAKRPCRVLRPQADGSIVDVTRQLFGNAALPSMVQPRELVAGDFNGDGRTDIFIAAHGYDAPPFPGETNVLLISNPDGTFTDRSSTLPQAPDFSHSACVGDVNGDGRSDIYVGNIDGRVGPYLLLGNGDGTFVKTRIGLPETVILQPHNTLMESYLACTLLDLDSDGFPDLVLGAVNPNASTNSVIHFNDGTGDFTKRPRATLPTGPFGSGNTTVLNIASLDINRDGRPDLILMSQHYNPPPSDWGGFGLQILINQGAGAFADETATRLPAGTSRPTGPYCISVRLADFNGDGWEDFYCDTNGWDDTSERYWINQGGGIFTGIPGTAMPHGSNRGAVQAVDFDGDGRPDLLQAGANQDADIFYRSFLNRTPRTVPSEPIIGAAVAGNAQATIAFTKPLSGNTIPISGYTASCTQGSRPGTFSTSGAASPLTVPGLANGKPYICSVTASSAAGTSLPSRAVSVRPLATILDLNQHGLTGSWYEPATSGQGVEVEVFPNPSSGTGSTFVSWFTYDTVGGGAERQRWYTAQGQVVTGQPNASLTVYQNTGGNFNAPPVTNAQAVGTATLSFDTCSSGQLAYAFTDGTGRTGTIPLTRLTQNVTCSTTSSYPTNADFAFSGNWYDPATSGQGLSVEVNPISGEFFAAWYTYVPNGAGSGVAGQRWYTAQAGFTPGLRSIPVTIYETTGGVFDTATPPGQKTVPVGTGTMAFQSCSAATFSYNFTGGSSGGQSGTINLNRVGPLPPGCTP